MLLNADSICGFILAMIRIYDYGRFIFFFVEYVWPVYSRAGPVWDGVEVKVTARMMTWNNFGNGKRVSLNYIIVNRITATFNPYAPSQCNPSCFDGTQTKITQLNIIYVRWGSTLPTIPMFDTHPCQMSAMIWSILSCVVKLFDRREQKKKQNHAIIRE